jgi:hypothetical protein
MIFKKAASKVAFFIFSLLDALKYPAVTLVN